MNIVYIGDLRGAYRAKGLLQVLWELGYDQVYVNSLKVKKAKILSFLMDALYLMSADLVIVGPAQHNNRLVRWAVRLHKPIITDFYFSFYDTVVLDRNSVPENSIKAERLRQLDQYVLLHSTAVLFLTAQEREYYCRLLDVPSEKVASSVFPVFVPEKKAADLAYFSGRRSVFQFCWVGTYIPLQGLEKIIEALVFLKEKKIDFHFYIWGDSAKKAAPYQQLIDERQLTEYVTIRHMWNCLEEWETFMVEECDLCLGIFGDSQKAQLVTANKVLDGIAFRLPVLTGFSEGLAQYFSGSEDIFFTEAIPETIAQQIEFIMHMSKSEIKQHVATAYQVYERVFSYQAFKQNWQQLLQKEGWCYDDDAN